MNLSTHIPGKRFALYAWGVLVFTVLVILWGAYVRATGSGAGCGSHWPLCNGALVPDIPHHTTFIEFAHRVSSGIALLLVIGLLVWIMRRYAQGSAMRWAGWFALVFIITESLLGATLVVFELVGNNTSVARAVWMALHLINTFLLLMPLTLSAWWATHGVPTWEWPGWRVAALVGGAFLGTLLLGASGAVAALGDTLFPAASLAEGFEQDWQETAHFLVRLRIWHPLIAILVGAYLSAAVWALDRRIPTVVVRRLALLVTGLFMLQLAVGALNVVLMAPVAMQLIHLLLAAAIWVSLVLFVNETLVPETAAAHQGVAVQWSSAGSTNL